MFPKSIKMAVAGVAGAAATTDIADNCARGLWAVVEAAGLQSGPVVFVDGASVIADSGRGPSCRTTWTSSTAVTSVLDRATGSSKRPVVAVAVVQIGFGTLLSWTSCRSNWMSWVSGLGSFVSEGASSLSAAAEAEGEEVLTTGPAAAAEAAAGSAGAPRRPRVHPAQTVVEAIGESSASEGEEL